MHLGRERPPKTRPGTVIREWQRGSLTPQMPPSLLPTIAPTATRAANSAARLTVVKLLIAKNIATSPADAITLLSQLVDQRTAHEQGGPLLPGLCSPISLRFRSVSVVPKGNGSRDYSRGSTGSLSRARTPNTHSWMRLNGSRRTNRSSPSTPQCKLAQRQRPLPRKPTFTETLKMLGQPVTAWTAVRAACATGRG